MGRSRAGQLSLPSVTLVVLIISMVLMTVLLMTSEVEAWPAGKDKKMFACRFLKQNGLPIPPKCNPKADWH